MNQYTVYIKAFGKTYKCEISANTHARAEEKAIAAFVKKNIQANSILLEKPDPAVEHLMKFFGMN